jgi:hypothetical protein
MLVARQGQRYLGIDAERVYNTATGKNTSMFPYSPAGVRVRIGMTMHAS